MIFHISILLFINVLVLSYGNILSTKEAINQLETSETVMRSLESVEVRLLNGVDAPDSIVSFMANVITRFNTTNSRKRRACSASVLNRKWLLTAAHCFVNNTDFPIIEDSYVFVGEPMTLRSNESTKIKPYKIMSYLLHEEYDSSRSINDLAMVELDRPIEENRYSNLDIIPAELEDPVAGTTVMAAGYGAVVKDGKEFVSNHLQIAPLVIGSFSECKSMAFISWRQDLNENKQFCVIPSQNSQNRPTAACAGDSGGPVYSQLSNGRLVQFGIASFSTVESCAEPDGIFWYTRLSAYRTEILQALGGDFTCWDVHNRGNKEAVNNRQKQEPFKDRHKQGAVDHRRKQEAVYRRHKQEVKVEEEEEDD